MNSQLETKRFFIKTLGCKVNQYESEAMREILISKGFVECLNEHIADIFIVNTCAVTSKADKESRHYLAHFHKINPKARIVVTGCCAENSVDNLSFLPGVANIVKNDDKARIADILSPQPSAMSDSNKILKISDFRGHSKAFVKIQDGCDNFCSYCTVPLVRNRIGSKPSMNVLEEVSGLVARGFKEIVLAGICLGSWGRDLPGSPSLVSLLKEFDRITGDFRVRLSSIEPRNVTDELLDFIASSKLMCRHIHIPMQSGDDEILKKMNRPYNSAEYAALIDKAKTKIEGVSLTTDVMIGFPGESEDNFMNTVKLVKIVKPLKLHIFTFSRRPGTAAERMGGIPDDATLKRRYNELYTAGLSSSYVYRRQFLHKELDVLVETKRDKLTGMLKGYSSNYIKVLFPGGDELMKNIVSVKLDYINLLQNLGVYDGQ